MLKILQTLLEAGKIDQEAAELIDKDLSGELKKLRDEAAQWRTKYKELNQTYEEVADSKVELEKQLESIDERIAKAREEGKKELVKELEAERAQKAELGQKLSELEAKNREYRLQAALSQALEKYDVVDKEVVFDALKLRVTLDGDEVKFKSGEDLQSGIEAFFSQKPHLLKAKGETGSGAGGGVSGFGKDTLTARLLSRRG